LITDGRQRRADERVSGGMAKLRRCTGAVIKGATGCPVLVRAYMQKSKEWGDTESCSAGAHELKWSGRRETERPSCRSVEAEASALVSSNHNISSDALAKRLKVTSGISYSDRTASRMRANVLGKDLADIKGQYQMLDSCCSALARNNGNIVEC
ncbi:unnamed protein product, partial [Pylaiella littoralis]